MKQVHEYLDPGKEMKFENELGHRVWGDGGVEQLSTEQASEQEESNSQQQRRKVRQQAQPRRPWGGCPCATLRADRPGLFFWQHWEVQGARAERVKSLEGLMTRKSGPET